MRSKRRYHQPTSLRVTMGGKRAAEQENSGKGNSAGCPGRWDAKAARSRGPASPVPALDRRLVLWLARQRMYQTALAAFVILA